MASPHHLIPGVVGRNFRNDQTNGQMRSKGEKNWQKMKLGKAEKCCKWTAEVVSGPQKMWKRYKTEQWSSLQWLHENKMQFQPNNRKRRERMAFGILTQWPLHGVHATNQIRHPEYWPGTCWLAVCVTVCSAFALLHSSSFQSLH